FRGTAFPVKWASDRWEAFHSGGAGRKRENRCAPSLRSSRGEGVGGLRPPFFNRRTPMRSIGYGEGLLPQIPKTTCPAASPPHPQFELHWNFDLSPRAGRG